MVQVLGTAPAATTLTEVRGFFRTITREQVLHFEEWTIDGVPLWRLVAAADGHVSEESQGIAPLAEEDPWPEIAVEALERLLGVRPGDFDDGRVALLVCPVDADLGCGALSARLVMGEGVVEWRELGWQVDYEPYDASESALTPPTSFVFDRGAYVAVLDGLLARYRDLARRRDDQAARGRHR